MKRFLLIICLLLICSTGWGAEFLVQAKDHWMDDLTEGEVAKMSEADLQSYKARGQKGDIIVVRPDGWDWQRDERLPIYHVRKVPEIKYEDAKIYEESLYDRTDPENPIMIRERKYAIDKAEIDLARLGELNVVQVGKTEFLREVVVKTGAADEIVPPRKGISFERSKPARWIKTALGFWEGKAWSAQFLYKTVKPSGGDYSSMEAAVHGNEQDLTGDGWFDLEADGTWSSADTTKVNIHNYTTTALDYINIYTTSAARHPGCWANSSPYYRLYYNGTNDGASLLNIVGNYVTVTGLQLFYDSTNYDYGSNTLGVGVSQHHVTVDKCIVIHNRGTPFFYSDYGENPLTIRNSVFLRNNDSESAGYAFYIAHYTGADNLWPIDNCVFVHLGSGTAFYYNSNSPSSQTVRNSYAHSASGTGFASSTGNGETFTTTTCASSDGSNSTATVAYSTATFTNVTAGTEDFHLPNTSSDLYDAGTDLSGTFTDDIDGQTRVQWDIGADEYVSAAARRVMLIQ